MMNCKYCGAALPTRGGHCPSCGRMIPIDQQKTIKQMIDPKWNTYRNKDTAFYKQNFKNKEDEKIGKIIFAILAILIIIIIIVVCKGIG